jgi:TPP-dependent pyruvate/acetoin dehydrogenase alpha subunit
MFVRFSRPCSRPGCWRPRWPACTVRGRSSAGSTSARGRRPSARPLVPRLTPGRDVYGPLIRDQAGRTAFGEPIIDCPRTYLGSVEGPMRGRDGNIHRGRPLEGVPAMISHLGTAVSVVCGMLFARRLRGKLDGVVGGTSVGDGATSTGSFHEAVNMAAVEKLPLVVVVVNNRFAYSTPNDRQFACENLLDRAIGYGVGGHEVDGTDMLECIEVVSRAVHRARQGEGPQMIVANLLRLSGHGEHDDASYVPEEMRESGLGRDCLEVAEKQIIERGGATREEIDRVAQDLQRGDPAGGGAGATGARSESLPGLVACGGECPALRQRLGGDLRLGRIRMSVTYIDAIRAAQESLLHEDPRVFLYGQDIGRFGGAFKATQGLQEQFPGRVFRLADQRGRDDRDGDWHGDRGDAPDHRDAVRGFFRGGLQPDRQPGGDPLLPHRRADPDHRAPALGRDAGLRAVPQPEHGGDLRALSRAWWWSRRRRWATPTRCCARRWRSTTR